MADKIKIEYLLETGYAGFVGGASLTIPTAGIYEVTEEQALYLIETFPDWFKLIEEGKPFQEPPLDMTDVTDSQDKQDFEGE